MTNCIAYLPLTLNLGLRIEYNLKDYYSIDSYMKIIQKGIVQYFNMKGYYSDDDL